MSGTGLNEAVEYHVVNSLGWPALRPLQQAAVEPIRSGDDCLLLAPTAGGKTEAAFFPLLSQVVEESWRGLCILYITPLRALLNNLHPRLEAYAAWTGHRVGLWHGDVGPTLRRRMLNDPPEVLLTTPESLEAMLVSRRVDHRALFSNLRAVVIDEVHAFAGDDRGWHLLAVLERIQRLADKPLQRIGLSATLGNPDSILRWLQGSGVDNGRPSRVIVEDPIASALMPEIVLDYVGTLDNAAEVISRLHRGEKRLAFCSSRSDAEELAYALRQRNVTTFVSHASLSADERRISESAFAESRDCVIVSTSTMELGIDVGDLDRVIQIDSTWTVSSFLQRLGRTGRRTGTTRNTLFLTTTHESLLRAAAILHLWSQGFVEPVLPPPSPNHIAAQQLLALALQESQVGANRWAQWWGSLPVMEQATEILEYLRSAGYLETDGGMLFIGPEAEKKFGRRHFMDVLSAFTAAPELRVIAGQREIGSVSPLTLAQRNTNGEGLKLLLSGRSWCVEAVEWDKHIVRVSELKEKGRSKWESDPVPQSFELMQAMRKVLLGATPDIQLSKRAVQHLAEIRDEGSNSVDEAGIVVERGDKEQRVWTWAGLKANLTILAALNIEDCKADNSKIRLPSWVPLDQVRAASSRVHDAFPAIAPDAVEGLKFSAALPLDLAVRTLSIRTKDSAAAAATLAQPNVMRHL
ncbi:DEAD/DEAH box helicase [Arthrobacter sp. Marseille-P9274]|uniref:DEAD/DEAH box helicase n=1 Tax=Arthrobacter sp. Marseille-P9274 TaxID=2866572 RepID=UPI0021C5A4FB|nr:DEAD/DEAH box helicase [Arthrobacter sp. Marseille-P9274]